MKYPIIIYSMIVILLVIILFATGIFSDTKTLNASVSFQNNINGVNNNLYNVTNLSHQSPIITRVTSDISCGQWCVAELQITHDRNIYYNNRDGDRYFNQKESNITQEELSQFLGLFDEKGFFSLNMTYDCDNRSSDAQESVYTYQDGGIDKAVYVYEGCSLPPGLKAIDDEMNRIQARII